MAPNRIGRYEIREELGRGGMSTVFLAYDPSVDRQVAVKMLPREFLHSTEFRQRFNREAKIIAALEHPAIVPIYDFGEHEGQPYFVMRYLPGGSLADRLHNGRLPLDEALAILERVGGALDYAHSRGVIHRDLKPANILFDRQGKAYLGDFGIARLEETGATLTGTVYLGTPAYMSPEQVEATGELTGRADIYALGVILFEILTGQKPYQAETPAGLALKHLIEPVPSVLAVRPDLPPDVERVVDRAMAKKPEDRYPTAVELTADVTKAVGAFGPAPVMPPERTVASPPAGATVKTPQQQARRVRGPVIAAGLAILAIACLAAAAILIGGNDGLFGGEAATDTPTPTASLTQAPSKTATLELTVTPVERLSPTSRASPTSAPTAAATEAGPTPTLRATNSPVPTRAQPTSTPTQPLPTSTSPPVSPTVGVTSPPESPTEPTSPPPPEEPTEGPTLAPP